MTSGSEVFHTWCHLPRFNDNMEHMATFIVLAKIIHFRNTKYLGLEKFLSSENFRLYGTCAHSPVKRVSIVGDYDVWFDVQNVVKELPK